MKKSKVKIHPILKVLGITSLIILAILSTKLNLSPPYSSSGPPGCTSTATSNTESETQGSCTCTTTKTQVRTICNDIETLRKTIDLTQDIILRTWRPSGCGPASTNPVGNYISYTTSTTNGNTYSQVYGNQPISQSSGGAVITLPNGDVGSFIETTPNMPSCF